MAKMPVLKVTVEMLGGVPAYLAMREALKLIVDEGTPAWGVGISTEAELAQRVLDEVERLEAKG